MQALYKILMTIEVLSGIFLAILVITQKSNSDGLISKTSNPFNSSSSKISPATKFTGIVAVVFLLNSLLLTSVNAKKDKKTMILNQEVLKDLTPDDE